MHRFIQEARCPDELQCEREEYRTVRRSQVAAYRRTASPASCVPRGAIGSRTRTWVPLSCSVTTLRVPFASLTRSLMLMRPRPLLSFRALAASNPWPSSPTVSSTLSPLRTKWTSTRPARGVFDNVVQRLLSDPVQGERRLRIERIDLSFGAAGDGNWMCIRDSSTVGGQGSRQSTVPEHVGVQIV